VAQHNALAQRGLFLPQLTGNSTSSQILVANPGQVPPVPTESPQSQFSLVTHQLTVSFVPDVWGANIRAVENLDAVTEQQLFQLEAAYLALTSNVVTAAIQEASLRGQIAATQRIIAIERHLLDILKRQFGNGQVAKADVLSQEAALAAAEQLLPPLEKALALQRDLLTALAGQYAADEIVQKFDLAHLKLPANLPISLPSKLVDQRPDVRAAEASMHSASAQVGVSIAARLPNFVLSANGGSTAFNFAQSFTPGTGFYTLAASATAPIFDGFALYNKQKAAEAARPASGCARNKGRATRGRHCKGKPRRRGRAAKGGSGQPARRAQCAADLSGRFGDPRANRSQSSCRYRRAVPGTRRRLAGYLHDTSLAGLRDGRGPESAQYLKAAEIEARSEIGKPQSEAGFTKR
jgi:NodT family efflux transporter outer membrane factor (OMF) lipoprotein